MFVKIDELIGGKMTTGKYNDGVIVIYKNDINYVVRIVDSGVFYMYKYSSSIEDDTLVFTDYTTWCKKGKVYSQNNECSITDRRMVTFDSTTGEIWYNYKYTFVGSVIKDGKSEKLYVERRFNRPDRLVLATIVSKASTTSKYRKMKINVISLIENYEESSLEYDWTSYVKIYSASPIRLNNGGCNLAIVTCLDGTFILSDNEQYKLVDGTLIPVTIKMTRERLEFLRHIDGSYNYIELIEKMQLHFGINQNVGQLYTK